MKHAILVVGLVVGLANAASAQITEVHTRCGENGSHFSLAAGTSVFNYEATICGATVGYVATLEVFHNGILKHVSAQVVLFPPPGYLFASAVNMGSWGLTPGDQVTFRLKVVRLGSTQILAGHLMTGDVTPAEPGPKTE
ncbi:MAG TPA: hypothetical protein VFC86_09190 [Planctomycetota bacterium]|nr:hypothetical protein [Planctomycetota bacterium]